MSFFLRRLIACLLIAFVPLQVTAATRMALCAGMGAVYLQQEHTVSSAPCAHMDSMNTQKPSEMPSSSTHHGDCWLGSICLAGLFLPPLPVTPTGLTVEHNTQTYFARTAIFHSIVPETPLRPPATP